MLSQTTNFILQSLYTASLLAELQKNNFLDSEYFDKLPFQTSCIKDELKKIGVCNRGAIMMILYAMLVLPKELTTDKYRAQQHQINDYLDRVCTTTKRYKPSGSIDYFRHFRNAVAHAKAEFEEDGTVTFRDKNRQGEEFEANISLSDLEGLVDKLQIVHAQYVANVRAGRTE